MPQNLSTSSSEQHSKPVSPDRELSWRVATNLWISFRYAWGGIRYAFRSQRNFRIHVLIGGVAIAASFALHLPTVHIAVIVLTCGAVMAMELLNTALESVVDLTVQQTYHELAKIAKDCAAAAVMIFALVAVAIALLLLLPPFVTLVQGYWAHSAALL